MKQIYQEKNYRKKQKLNEKGGIRLPEKPAEVDQKYQHSDKIYKSGDIKLFSCTQVAAHRFDRKQICTVYAVNRIYIFIFALSFNNLKLVGQVIAAEIIVPEIFIFITVIMFDQM